jgi:hypothetical protein
VNYRFGSVNKFGDVVKAVIKWSDRCPRCRKKMTPEGWIRAEGYVCTRCVEIERAATNDQ